ncbi:CRISPR system precrRNA processing endoribonuclease RAMP protein Cas6 [Nocardiopsis sp. NPDC006139]|uniref:CRISPR system precrRNA processing endoribonuclease RAMP protein Cas6 n=1 Tax=unclassified Nocardiopsis TaxID=2649073 RepID=UPI0033B419BD
MVPVPRRWTVILRDRADTARPIRPEDCHGLLNRWWPHPPEEHALAKRWAMNGWPAPLGDRLYHWTLTWLDDEVPPPSDPEEAVGRVQRIGDHLLEPLSVTRTFDRRYGELLAGPRGPLPVRSAELRSRTPVVTATRDSSGERIPHVWPGPRRIFGAVHRSGGGIVGGSGAMGAVARFAPPALAGAWLESAFEGLDLVRRLPVPGEEIRLAEHHQAEGRTVLGWQGGLRLELTGGDRRHAEAFTALLELVELTGVGKYTAQGFGSVLVDTVTPGAPSSAAVAQRARRAPQRPPSRPGPLETRAAVAGLEEFGGLLFD